MFEHSSAFPAMSFMTRGVTGSLTGMLMRFANSSDEEEHQRKRSKPKTKEVEDTQTDTETDHKKDNTVDQSSKDTVSTDTEATPEKEVKTRMEFNQCFGDSEAIPSDFYHDSMWMALCNEDKETKPKNELVQLRIEERDNNTDSSEVLSSEDSIEELSSDDNVSTDTEQTTKQKKKVKTRRLYQRCGEDKELFPTEFFHDPMWMALTNEDHPTKPKVVS